MTGKERIRATYERKPVDRVPLHFKNDEPPLTDGLMRLLNVGTREEVLRKLGVDIRLEAAPYIGPELGETPQGDAITHWGTVEGTYSDVLPRPLAEVESICDLKKWTPPSPDWFDYQTLSANCASWTDCAVVVHSWEPFFCGLCDVMGMEKALMTLAADPELAFAVLDIMSEFILEKVRRITHAVKGKADMVYFGDDFASDRALLMGYPLWKKFFKKPLSQVVGIIRDAGLHAHVHTCGAVNELLPDYIDMGVESIEPCQFHLQSMDPHRIKKEFGDHLIFLGGVDSQHVLPFGSPEDVRREVRSRIDVLGAGGGYICASDHSLLADIPPENVVAMYAEAVKEKKH